MDNDQAPRHEPTHPAPSYPPPGYAPPPVQSSRAHRPWRSIAVGAAVGGVLAAAVAVPSTWLLTRNDGASNSTTSQTLPNWSALQDPSQQEDPSQQDGGLQQLPGGSSGEDPSQQFPGQTQQDPSQSDTSTKATDAESKGVVLIETTLTDGSAAGTGLVIDSSGLVLTNYHVVEGSTSVKVTIATDGTTYTATVVGHDQKADVALLQLEGASGLDTVTLDDDDDPAVGDTVTAVGNAEGQGYLSAASGDVVGLEKSITTSSEGSVAGEKLSGMIETNASVVGGYSGGALLDDEGEVVGITTAASSGGAADSYAVPIDDAMSVAEQIESGDESGDVVIGPSAYLGVGVSDGGSGVEIMQVESGSAAADAGLSAGDVITHVGSTRVKSVTGLKSALASYEPGDQVVLTWTGSNGRTHETTVTLGSSPTN